MRNLNYSPRVKSGTRELDRGQLDSRCRLVKLPSDALLGTQRAKYPYALGAPDVKANDDLKPQ